MRDISLHIMDIVQNSISAGATNIRLLIESKEADDILSITVEDNGRGIDKALLERITDPFTTTRTTRKIGLGIPLLMDSARMAGGDLAIKSLKGKGTTLRADFKITHIDRPPIGDLAETATSLIGGAPEIRYYLEFRNKNNTFRLDTQEIKERLGDVPINNFEVLLWIKEYVDEGIILVFGGVLNEVTSRT